MSVAHPFAVKPATTVAEVIALLARKADLEITVSQMSRPGSGSMTTWDRQLHCVLTRLRRTSRTLKRAAQIAIRLTT